MDSTVFVIHDDGKIEEVGTWGLSPKKSLICAINQYLQHNYYTWRYNEGKWNPNTVQYEKDMNKYKGIKKTKRGYAYFFGDNSTLYVREALEVAC